MSNSSLIDSFRYTGTCTCNDPNTPLILVLKLIVWYQMHVYLNVHLSYFEKKILSKNYTVSVCTWLTCRKDIIYWLQEDIFYFLLTADDEQSDFYYESGPACGNPGIIRWWENDSGDIESESDRQFQQILSGSLEQYVQKSSQLAFRARVTRMMAKVWLGHKSAILKILTNFYFGLLWQNKDWQRKCSSLSGI